MLPRFAAVVVVAVPVLCAGRAVAAPPARSCAPFTGDPAAVYGAGLITASSRDEALRLAREQALGEIAGSVCATVDAKAGAPAVVRPRAEGLEGIEEVERWTEPDGVRTTACVVLKVARLKLDLRRRADEATLAAAERAAADAPTRCPAEAAEAVARARASLVSLCPGLTTPRGQSVGAVAAALDAARDQAEARLATAARDVAVGVACSAASSGEPIACPQGLLEAARAALSQRDVAVSAEALSAEAARQVSAGTRPAGVCAPSLAVLQLAVDNQTQQASKRATEHYAVVSGGWVVLSAGRRREGARASVNGGGYSSAEALTVAARRLAASALWP